MFESARLPHAMTKEDFVVFETRLRERLLDAQFELAEQKRAAVLVLINGSDGAGKGEVVNRLYDWLDDHFLETLSYGAPTDEERARPGAWRYWRDMPAKGRIGLVLGSWHHRALRNRALGRLDKAAYNDALEEMNSRRGDAASRRRSSLEDLAAISTIAKRDGAWPACARPTAPCAVPSCSNGRRSTPPRSARA